MKSINLISSRIFNGGLILLLFCCFGCAAQQGPITLDRNMLSQNLAFLNEGDEELIDAVNDIKRQADSVSRVPNLKIVDKKQTPPSGDKRDYLSVAQYWWPDPSKPDGLPYIPKDGQTNPEFYEIKDNGKMIELARNLNILGIAYYFTKDEKYAQKSISQIRTWFLDQETRMNPNFTYAQYIPGVNEGRREGIIDARSLVDAVDGITLIRQSVNWSQSDELGIQKWFSDFLNWMQTSKNGKGASELVNNIGTAYYMQLLSFSIFTGNNSVARQALHTQIPKMIDHQFDEDGKQPEELRRTNAWNYSIANLNYWFRIARIAEKVNVDLWNYVTPTGKSIRTGYEWMIPYADGKEWPYQQIQKTNFGRQFLSLRIRGDRKYYNRSNFLEQRRSISGDRNRANSGAASRDNNSSVGRSANEGRVINARTDVVRPSAITILTEGY